MIPLYLAAIILANLTVAAFGPPATIPVAFVLIAFDLTTRDELHRRWEHDGLFPKMLLLIAAGGLLSYVASPASGTIALASCVAFLASSAVDATAYHLLRSRPWWQRVNGSNVFGALTDSLVFPYLAFGGWLWPIVAGQFAAKVAGGAMWAAVLRRWQAREAGGRLGVPQTEKAAL